MSTKTERKAGKRADARAGRVPPVSEKLAQLKAVVRDLGAATEAITSSRPPAAVRERFTEAVGQAHATVQEALATLRAVESLLEGGLAEMPRPDAEGYYPAAETLRAILAHQLAERRQKAGLTQAELARRA